MIMNLLKNLYESSSKLNEASDWGWTEQHQKDFEKEMADLKALITDTDKELNKAEEVFLNLHSAISDKDSYIIKKLQELKPELIDQYKEYSKKYNQLKKDLEYAQQNYRKISSYSPDEWDPQGTVGGAKYRNELFSKYYKQAKSLENDLKELSENCSELISFIKEFETDYQAAAKAVRKIGTKSGNNDWSYSYDIDYDIEDVEPIRKVYGDEAADTYTKLKDFRKNRRNLNNTISSKKANKEKAIAASKYNLATSDTPIGQVDIEDIEEAVKAYLIKEWTFNYDHEYSREFNLDDCEVVVWWDEDDDQILFDVIVDGYSIDEDGNIDWGKYAGNPNMTMKEFSKRVESCLNEVLDDWYESGEHDLFYKVDEYDPY